TSALADIQPFIIGLMHTFGKAKRINQCVSNEKHDSQIGTPCMGVELERALATHESDNQQQRLQFEQAKEGVSALNRLLPRLNLLA
ncbi:hypothetical protein MJM59_29645, partial [Salmonella enterica subsp. enterica serovar Montevideo]|nr:hypothetical protein [Salmonella enterica subsp. enterica serovar Montevideo]